MKNIMNIDINMLTGKNSLRWYLLSVPLFIVLLVLQITTIIHISWWWLVLIFPITIPVLVLTSATTIIAIYVLVRELIAFIKKAKKKFSNFNK